MCEQCYQRLPPILLLVQSIFYFKTAPIIFRPSWLAVLLPVLQWFEHLNGARSSLTQILVPYLNKTVCDQAPKLWTFSWSPQIICCCCCVVFRFRSLSMRCKIKSRNWTMLSRRILQTWRNFSLFCKAASVFRCASLSNSSVTFRGWWRTCKTILETISNVIQTSVRRSGTDFLSYYMKPLKYFRAKCTGFEAFWCENGYKFCWFWSEIGHVFRASLKCMLLVLSFRPEGGLRLGLKLGRKNRILWSEKGKGV